MLVYLKSGSVRLPFALLLAPGLFIGVYIGSRFKYLHSENAERDVGCIYAPYANFAVKRRLPLRILRCMNAPYQNRLFRKLTMEILSLFVPELFLKRALAMLLLFVAAELLLNH